MKSSVWICTICIFLFVVGHASAWEADVHYGLTKWLAFEAGFSLEDAEAIAAGAQTPDEGKLYPAPWAVIKAACLSRDSDVVRLVQKYHFPSYGPMPGAPRGRVVTPGLSAGAATDLIDTEIQTNLPSRPKPQTLQRLGEALHPLEDSWAHQGMPDSPFPWLCSADYSFGHPTTRGGWRSHNADLTYLHPIPDTMQTAQYTYLKLETFLQRHPSYRSHPATPWKSLEPEIERFAGAATKNDKLTWFNAQKAVPLSSYTTHPDFLSHVNLPQSINPKQMGLNREWRGPASFQLVGYQAEIPKDVGQFVDTFLNTWIVHRNLDAALAHMNTEEVAQPFLGSNRNPTETRTVTRDLLAMWLVADHGVVNALGHGLDLKREANYPFEKFPMIQAETLRSAISLEERARETPYGVFPVKIDDPQLRGTGESYAVLFQFKHAPRDAVVLVVTQDAHHEWQVSHMLWWIL